MKKIVIVLCFLGLFLSKSEAQNEIRFGFQFSPTLSWMKTDAKRINNNGGLILGAKLGAVGEYYFRENITYSSLSSSLFSARYNSEGFIFDTKGSCIFLEKNKIISSRIKEDCISFNQSVTCNFAQQPVFV